MIVAFQHHLKATVSSKSAGRLKAMGCLLDDPLAWCVPKRVNFSHPDFVAGKVLYVGAGVKRLGIKPSPWAKHL